MRAALFALIATAALAAPVGAQPPQYNPSVGIYPSLTTLPRARLPNGVTYTVYPAPNTPLFAEAASYPFLANGRVYTMGQMYQAQGGYRPYVSPWAYSNPGYYSGGYYSGYYGGWRR